MNIEEIKNYILKNFRSSFITGSYCFSDGTVYQDIDIVLCPFVVSDFDLKLAYFELEGCRVKSGDYNISKKIYPSDVDVVDVGPYVNIILVHPLEWHCWRIGTEMMNLLPYVPEEKIKRHALFENIRASVKMSLPETYLGLDSIIDVINGNKK